MKRLLASGLGPIYEIGKVFRDGEVGARHNLEFTMLEWYRPGFDVPRLIDEVDDLLAATLGTRPGERFSYAEAFARHLAIEPHAASVDALRAVASEEVRGLAADDRDGWLQWLFATRIEPELGLDRPAYVFDFPESQAALARIRPGDRPVAERFEVFVRGLELANGYHEEIDASELRRRFEADRVERRRRGLSDIALDERFLAAHEDGLPECGGVALGLDRLAMLAVGSSRIRDVLTFPTDVA
jgi:lysyl-tRNA synthetase class 2